MDDDDDVGRRDEAACISTMLKKMNYSNAREKIHFKVINFFSSKI